MVELLGEKGHDQDAAWSEDEIGVLQKALVALARGSKFERCTLM